MFPPDPGHRPATRLKSRSLPVLAALIALLPVLLAPSCEQIDNPALSIGVNGIPASQSGLLVLPRYGFTVQVTFDDPSFVIPETLSVTALPFDTGVFRSLDADLVDLWSDGAVMHVSAANALSVGSYTLAAAVETADGTLAVQTMHVAVREHAGGAPLAALQWIWLDFDADRDSDLQPDLPVDLQALGLGSVQGSAASQVVRDQVVTEILARSQAFYDAPLPGGLPGPDPANVWFSDQPNPGGVETRLCVGGENPGGGSAAGNVNYDPGNANPADQACANYGSASTGVFPRELLYFGFAASFQAAFGPLQATPVGSDPLDDTVLGPGYDPGDPAQQARHDAIQNGIDTFAQAVATIVAHETAHALGLVPPGAPGGGLFGGASGVLFTHDATTSGGAPAENWLMNAGTSFSFDELIGANGFPLPRFRALNHAYLRGRLVVDPLVTGIFHAPWISGVTPGLLDPDGASVVKLTITGKNFASPPLIQLLGPSPQTLLGASWVDATHVSGWVVVGQLLPGVYDLQVRNPDGQTFVRPGAVTLP